MNPDPKIVALLISAVGVLLSYIVARKYGDVAAVKASRKLHEEDARRARKTALRALLNEVERIKRVVKHNSTLEAKKIAPVTRMPVTALETAFVSGKSGLDVSEELLQAVTEYLVYADSVNSLVGVYGFSIPGEGTGSIAPKSIVTEIKKHSGQDSISEVLERLTACLKKEIDLA